MTADDNTFKKGNLVITMDAMLAGKIDEFMARTMADCEDGRKFDAEHPNKRDGSHTYGQVICLAETFIPEVQKSAPFADIGLVEMGPEPFVLKETAGNAKDALLVVQDFVETYATLLATPDVLVDQVSVYVFALAINKVINGAIIGAQMVLDLELWKSNDKLSPSASPSPSSSSSLGCPDPTETPMFCGYEDENDCTAKFPFKDGLLLMGTLLDQKVVCKDGEFKDCPCDAPFLVDMLTIDEELSDSLGWYLDLIKRPKDNQKPGQCSQDSSRVSLTYWLQLYPKFCEEVKKDPRKELKKTYAFDEIKPQRRSYPINKRSPQPNPDEYKGLEFGFQWSGGECITSCEDAYRGLAQGDCGGSSNIMRSSGTKDLGCGKYSYSISQIKGNIVCCDKTIQAPRGAQEAEGGTSLDAAIEQWCTDNNFRKVNKGENVYQWYGVTSWGVPNRNSFWLRGAITCGDQETIIKDDCIKALSSGMEQCSLKSGHTHGLAASIGCLDYSIDVSGVTRDDSPPWDQKTSFPPPEDAQRPDGGQHKVVCGDNKIPNDGKAISDDELNKVLNAFCVNGNPIRGFGKQPPLVDYMFRYAPTGRPKMLLGTILNGEPNAIMNNQKDWKPYKDDGWCSDYDWKMGKDDCTFALREMHKECSVFQGKSKADFTYRCVRYQYSYPIWD